MNTRIGKRRAALIALGAAILLLVGPAMAAETEGDPLAQAKEELSLNLNIVWTCVAAFLVFFMQAGFAMVEAGFTRAKNAVNIIMKNLMDFSVGSLAFFVVGGVLVVFSVIFIDRVLKVDDPVGAVSVHGVCGAWGTLACGLFNIDGGLFYGGGFAQLGVQCLGVGVAFAWAFGVGLVLFYGIKMYGLEVGYDLGKALGLPEQYGSVSLTGFLNYSDAVADNSSGFANLNDEFWGGFSIGWEW